MKLPVPKFRLILVAVVTFLTLCVIASLLWFFSSQYHDESMMHLHHYAETMAADVASAEADFIITENYASLQDSVLSFQQRVHVDSITIATPDGRIIADTQPANIGDFLEIPSRVALQSGGEEVTIDSSAVWAETLMPIQVGTSVIGWCRIVFSVEYIKRGMVALQWKTGVAALFAVVVLSIVLFFFSTAVTRPLEEIMNRATRVADGDFEQQARVTGVLEIRKLAESFNFMTTAIREREDRLRQAQKMEAIGVLSSSIAHEFGNPLVGIRFLLSDLKKKEGLDKETLALLDLGLGECDRMKKLVRDLKYFYQPSSETRTLVDLHEIIDNILLLQKSYLQSLKITVVTEYGAHLPGVEAVADQIQQVLVNLFLNAAEAMSADGGILTITTACKENTVQVAITDTGVGISREDQGKIFHPFVSTKPEVTGTGLGLWVSYGIVKNHQGDILLSSAPGKGATFTLVLPGCEARSVT